MIRVRTPSRLHFGLFNLGPAMAGPERHEVPDRPARLFGGVGLMVQLPGLQVRAEPASGWSATGPCAERALAFAMQFQQSLPRNSIPPQRLVIECGALEHQGLGTGTQLGLAVARLLAQLANQGELPVTDLAHRVGRGQRSGLGVHGFARGGFLVDGGVGPTGAIAPLVARLNFPESWRMVLVLSQGVQGLHGWRETMAFHNLGLLASDCQTTDRLCRLALLGMLPALAERDVAAFGEALYAFNVQVGEMFAPMQGGCYADPRTSELAAFVRRQGIAGVGQSSWGPAFFAVVDDQDRADDLAKRLLAHFGLEAAEVITTPADNRGAGVKAIGPGA